MDFIDISVGAWQFTYMLIALMIPVLFSMFVFRIFGKSARKTVRTFKK